MAKKQADADEGGVSLDDAFDDDEDVVYAEAKPRKKVVKKAGKASGEDSDGEVVIKGSKPIEKITKGDKIKVDSLTLEVDAHEMLIDHGKTKEMAIECFDPKKDKDYQIRYFSDQVATSIEVFELVEILYNKLSVKKIEW